MEQVGEERGTGADLVARARAWLREDRADEDVTTQSLVPEQAIGSARIVAKAAGVLAGLAEARAVFAAADDRLEWRPHADDGDVVSPGDVVARISGPLHGILIAERTALNVLQRMSGVATQTAAYVRAVDGTGARILATRKTVPGLRDIDVSAVLLGGGAVHRDSLAKRILVKENHLAAARAAGAPHSVADVARSLAADATVPVGIEVESLDELRAALLPGIEVVLLDDFDPDAVREARRLRDETFPDGAGPRLEASGGITLDTIRAYAEAGVERISVGALTHSVIALDLSLTVETEG